MLLKDKITVVIGGAGLLGTSFVSAIAAHGGTVVIADIDLARASAVAAELGKAVATPIVAEEVDITSKASLDALVERVTSRFGHIDAIVNNAYPRNRAYGRKLEDVEYSDFCENVNLHLGGYFLSMQRFALFFRRQGWGNIVNISSIYGVVAPRFDIYEGTPMTMPVEYAAIKAALQHITVYFMRYFKGHPIRFNCLAPGGIFDNQPEKFVAAYNSYAQSTGMLAPADLAGTLVFLLSDLSSQMNGQTLIVDDGWTA